MDQFNRALEAHIAELYPEEKKVLVFGDGNVHSRVMMIGEAPGEQESLQLKPFVGKAGKNLSAFLEVVGLKREEIYISNVVKLRPTKESPKTGKAVNRPPSAEEIAFFLPYLLEEIKVISPKAVVTRTIYMSIEPNGAAYPLLRIRLYLPYRVQQVL